MFLTEDKAAKITLVRSIEEVEPDRFSPKLRDDAMAGAGTVGTGLAWVEKRASYLFEHIPASYQSILYIIRLPTPWTLPLCGLAFIFGLATNLLGLTEKIHVVRNPVLALVAWNLLVYFAQCALLIFRGKKFAFRRSARPDARVERVPPAQRQDEAAKPSIVKLILPDLWQFFHRSVFTYQEKKSFANVVNRFRGNWLSIAAPLMVARSKCALHLGALFVAMGAIGGMYFRGLFQGYDVVWTSTFLTDESSVATFIGLLFGPSLYISQLFGLGLAEQISVARLMSPQGDEADAWIHLFAITVVTTVIIPRALLAAWQWRTIRMWSSRLTLSLDKYYGDVIEAPIRLFVEKEVERTAGEFSRDVAAFVSSSLYDEQIVPRLRLFRNEGGRVIDLKSDISSMTEKFLPQLTSFIAENRLPQFRTSLSARIRDMLKGVKTDFGNLGGPEEVMSDLKISASELAAGRFSGQLTATATVSIGTSIALVLGTIGGGVGKELGIAIIATLLGTTGPVGFLLGLLVGAVVAAGAWWYGGPRIIAGVEKIKLPAVVVSTTLWESRFERLIADGRNKCKDSVQVRIDENLKILQPKITEEILFRVRQVWVSSA
jgi:hypothetical protein